MYVIEFERQHHNVGPVKITRSVDWLIDDRGPDSRIEYTFDFKNLVRHAISDGKSESNKVKLPPAAASGESYAIRIDISPGRIIVSDAQGKELDRYPRPKPAEPLGKFGFKSEVALVVKSGPAQ
jgi:hypothetical protein